jgi:translation elongation factor EF-Tu-like GTPase
MAELPISHLTAKLYLLSTVEGGRQTPIKADVYRPQFCIGSLSASCRVDKIAKGALSPGEESNVKISLVHPERFGDALRYGNKFEIKEGSKVVGWGIIDELSV